ncbi:MAG: bifunctional adenosylcobinamide kinase/adenosylcobinamide-phosphate guanylyltransferase [Fretibacterium sp.]|nr:bifunctional adenosylcobinamide kinase/adenosylcobinamide-phosphate guanylyltransferase [Fretibacterium sp.]
MFYFVSGAVRSGKGEWAERMAIELSPNSVRLYLATARAADPEMRRRVALHQASRSERGFCTLERERDLAPVASRIPEGATVLLECLGTWVANEMFDPAPTPGGEAEPAALVADRVLEAVHVLLRRAQNLLIVSNDLFSDGVLYDAATEEYLRALGGLHVVLAREADHAVECVCGLARFAR